MDTKGTLAMKIMKDINVPLDTEISYWESNCKFVNYILRMKRNNIATSLQESYMSEYHEFVQQLSAGRYQVPSLTRSNVLLSQIRQSVVILSQHGNRYKRRERTLWISNFLWFISKLCDRVANKQKYDMRISQFATISDEALVMQCFENTVKWWDQEVNDPMKVNKAN